MIRFACSQCRIALEAPNNKAGGVIICRRCGHHADVPHTGPGMEDIPAALPSVVPETLGQATDDWRMRLLPPVLPAEAEQLGDPVFPCERATGDEILKLVFSGGLVVVGLCMLLFFVLQLIRQGTRDIAFLVPLLGLGLIAGGGFWLTFLLIGFRDRVLVFSNGLLVVRRGRVSVWRWDDVEAVRVLQPVAGRDQLGYALPDARPTKYILRHKAGTVFAFGPREYSNAERLAKVVQQETYQRMLPRAQAACQSNQGVEFGVLRAEARGIVYSGSAVSWNEIGSFDVRGGKVYIGRRGQSRYWAEVRCSHIENCHVFLALVEGILAKYQQGHR